MKIYLVESWGFEERCTQDFYFKAEDAMGRKAFLNKLINSFDDDDGWHGGVPKCRKRDFKLKMKLSELYEAEYGVDLLFARSANITLVEVQ